MPRPAGCVLAFDYGLKHIGVAVGQTVTRTASPLETISARDGKPDWTSVDRLVEDWRPHHILVGLPLNMDDTESGMSERARRFAHELARRSQIEVSLVDERLTSHAARSRSGQRSAGARRSKGVDDHAAAAALIAETWLNDDR